MQPDSKSAPSSAIASPESMHRWLADSSAGGGGGGSGSGVGVGLLDPSSAARVTSSTSPLTAMAPGGAPTLSANVTPSATERRLDPGAAERMARWSFDPSVAIPSSQPLSQLPSPHPQQYPDLYSSSQHGSGNGGGYLQPPSFAELTFNSAAAESMVMGGGGAAASSEWNPSASPVAVDLRYAGSMKEHGYGGYRAQQQQQQSQQQQQQTQRMQSPAALGTYESQPSYLSSHQTTMLDSGNHQHQHQHPLHTNNNPNAGMNPLSSYDPLSPSQHHHLLAGSQAVYSMMPSPHTPTEYQGGSGGSSAGGGGGGGVRGSSVRKRKPRATKLMGEDDDADSDDGQHTALRVKHACEPCKHSKTKCDDERPCGRCIKAGIADQCCDKTAKVKKSSKSHHAAHGHAQTNAGGVISGPSGAAAPKKQRKSSAAIIQSHPKSTSSPGTLTSSAAGASSHARRPSDVTESSDSMGELADTNEIVEDVQPSAAEEQQRAAEEAAKAALKKEQARKRAIAKQNKLARQQQQQQLQMQQQQLQSSPSGDASMAGQSPAGSPMASTPRRTAPMLLSYPPSATLPQQQQLASAERDQTIADLTAQVAELQRQLRMGEMQQQMAVAAATAAASPMQLSILRSPMLSAAPLLTPPPPPPVAPLPFPRNPSGSQWLASFLDNMLHHLRYWNDRIAIGSSPPVVLRPDQTGSSPVQLSSGAGSRSSSAGGSGVVSGGSVSPSMTLLDTAIYETLVKRAKFFGDFVTVLMPYTATNSNSNIMSNTVSSTISSTGASTVAASGAASPPPPSSAANTSNTVTSTPNSDAMMISPATSSAPLAGGVQVGAITRVFNSTSSTGQAPERFRVNAALANLLGFQDVAELESRFNSPEGLASLVPLSLLSELVRVFMDAVMTGALSFVVCPAMLRGRDGRSVGLLASGSLQYNESGELCRAELLFCPLPDVMLPKQQLHMHQYLGSSSIMSSSLSSPATPSAPAPLTPQSLHSAALMQQQQQGQARAHHPSSRAHSQSSLQSWTPGSTTLSNQYAYGAMYGQPQMMAHQTQQQQPQQQSQLLPAPALYSQQQPQMQMPQQMPMQLQHPSLLPSRMLASTVPTPGNNSGSGSGSVPAWNNSSLH